MPIRERFAREAFYARVIPAAKGGAHTIDDGLGVGALAFGIGIRGGAFRPRLCERRARHIGLGGRHPQAPLDLHEVFRYRLHRSISGYRLVGRMAPR